MSDSVLYSGVIDFLSKITPEVMKKAQEEYTDLEKVAQYIRPC